MSDVIDRSGIKKREGERYEMDIWAGIGSGSFCGGCSRACLCGRV